ncbi:hypothetical protein QLS71_014190 [Mariniflexile litorale]|uniref:Lipocalin-like protein n=1 Tax=Mariniflexile litorale TaxID=3045158 RepID=A0AAU7EEK0_9FLAO|nr:hypothetical protein [Mariniflexile sp. KMM 9835]MDQ8212926.1 hypothetical protein [Mariniflexile sp. KMM 9835]
MKNILKNTLLILVSIMLFNCADDDNNENTGQNDIIGEWRLTSGSFYNGADKFAFFNEDNTLDILRETTDNFKGNYHTSYTIDGSEITIEGLSQSGSITYTYILENGILALTSEFTSATLEKVASNTPILSDWITPLEIQEEGNAPWEGSVDIAFNYNKTQLLYGTTNGGDYIALISPTTFKEVGQITTTRAAYAVEVEKYSGSDKYIFQSDNGFDRFYGYFENINTLGVTSAALGSWIKGLASVNNTQIWVASSNQARLYLYNYFTMEIEDSIALEVQPKGLDYQNGLLYVCDGNFLHKCQTTPNFEVIESYGISNFKIKGAAFDGTNFWVNGYNSNEEVYKIIKTNLTL